MVHGLSCSTACGIFPDQGSDPCLLNWKVKAPGKPWALFLSLPKPCFPFCEKGMIIGLLEEFKKLRAWDCPGGPVVQIPSSQCREHSVDPWLGNPACCVAWQKKKNYEPVRALDVPSVVIAVITSTISPGTSALQALSFQA